MTEPLTWDEAAARLARELGEPVSGGRPLTPGWSSRTTRGAYGERTGPLPGSPLTTLDGRLLEEVMQLIDKQAGAAIPAGDRDFTGYIANVLFDDGDEVWADAARAGEAAGPLCARIRRWLEPVWGLRLPPSDYAHNDLNLSNILTDGEKITGVVDWDERGAALPGQLPCPGRAGRGHPGGPATAGPARGHLGHPRPAAGGWLLIAAALAFAVLNAFGAGWQSQGGRAGRDEEGYDARRGTEWTPRGASRRP